ncbi:MAG: hypothetical protein ACP5VR_06310 [Acidimicrobiales bacterium]
MTPSYVEVLVSTDGGGHWATLPGPLGLVSINKRAAIVALSSSQAVLLGTDEGIPDYAGLYPLEATKDGGRTWQLLSLPALPGQPPGESPQSLVALPDGALLAISGRPWQLLPSGSTSWCAISLAPAQAPGPYGVPWSFTVADGSLWWLATVGSTTVLDHLAVASLPCGQGRSLSDRLVQLQRARQAG